MVDGASILLKYVLQHFSIESISGVLFQQNSIPKRQFSCCCRGRLCTALSVLREATARQQHDGHAWAFPRNLVRSTRQDVVVGFPKSQQVFKSFQSKPLETFQDFTGVSQSLPRSRKILRDFDLLFSYTTLSPPS